MFVAEPASLERPPARPASACRWDWTRKGLHPALSLMRAAGHDGDLLVLAGAVERRRARAQPRRV